METKLEQISSTSIALSELKLSSEADSAVADNSGIPSTSSADPNPGEESPTKSKMSETSDDPEKSVQGNAPDDPEKSVQGDAPDDPEKSVQGDAPDDPEKSVQGDAPDDPEKSVQGNAPVIPVRKPRKFKKRIHFNTIIGIIEDMIVGDEFHVIQLKFLEKYWRVFVDSEENKHEYMTIFTEYTNLIEGFIESYIRKLIPDFEMDALIAELEYRKDYLDGEIFELLFTLTDFNVFKEMFLDYKMMKEGNIFGVEESLYVSQVQ